MYGTTPYSDSAMSLAYEDVASIPGMKKAFFISPKRPDRLRNHSAKYSMDTRSNKGWGGGVLSPRTKQSKREIDYLPASSINNKNGWSCTSISPHAFVTCAIITSPLTVLALQLYLVPVRFMQTKGWGKLRLRQSMCCRSHQYRTGFERGA
jgi:hypothetical protein